MSFNLFIKEMEKYNEVRGGKSKSFENKQHFVCVPNIKNTSTANVVGQITETQST